MINLFNKAMQIVNEELTRYERFRTNAENEYQAMSCGAFSPRFLAMVKKRKAEYSKGSGSTNTLAQ